MEAIEKSHDPINNFFKPIFPNSVNIITAPTSAGKTTFILKLLIHRDNCFVRPFDRVVVVLCNERVNGDIYENLNSSTFKVETCYLKEFIPMEILQNNTFLIFDDVSSLDDSIKESINVLCHHFDLAAVVFATQSILEENEFRNLMSVSHRLVVFFKGVAAIKLLNYIKKYYFVSSEEKKYLLDIIEYASKNKSIVLLELNDVSSVFSTKYFSIINFDTFFNETEKQTFIIPKMSEMSDFESTFSDYQTTLPDVSNFPPHSFLLVNANNVSLKSSVDEKAKKKITTKEQEWQMVGDSIQEDVTSGIRFKNQQCALNIARHLLMCKDLIISSDGKTMRMKLYPKKCVSVLDYLYKASRQGAPLEVFDPIYYKITKALFANNIPAYFIQNKNLLNEPKIKKIKKTLTD